MRNMILGTDWWTDCDDAVAVRLVCRAVKERKIRLLGVGINACMEYSVASLKGFLASEGVVDVPLGIDLAATNCGGGTPRYQKNLALSLCPNGSNADAEDAVRLYRRLLAESAEKVEIMEIGFLQVVVGLLESLPDDLSPLSGIELVKEKVSKMWVMAGKWDADGEKEHNFCLNPSTRAAGNRFCEICPVPVTFLGWEVGFDVISGGNLEEGDVLRDVLIDHGSQNGRCSWDPMLVLMALIGDERDAGYDTVVGTASVDAETGANYFVRGSKGNHRYVVKKYGNSYYENEINGRLKS